MEEYGLENCFDPDCETCGRAKPEPEEQDSKIAAQSETEESSPEDSEI